MACVQRQVLQRSVRLICKVVCEELLQVLLEKKRIKGKRQWVRDWLNNKRMGASETILRELHSTDPRECQAVMRLLPEQFEELLRLISPLITYEDTVMRNALPTRLKLEITLAFLASGTNFRMLSVFFRTSKASISNIIPEVCDAIITVLKDFIKVPDQEEWENIQVGFHHRWNFPGCCGAIDGKHIVIKAPNSSGSEFHNYKGTNSIVLLAIVDHDYCFKYINVGSYGRNADGGVFQVSDVYPLLENEVLLPKGGVLVGDDAFPLKTYLLKPYSKPKLSHEERIYNYRTSRARRIVENAFGILVSRFRIFSQPITLKVSTTKKITKATCTLHNWLRTKSPQSYTPPGSVDYEDIVNTTVVAGQWRVEINELRSIQRSRSMNRHSKIAHQLRERYKEHFSGDWAVEWQERMIA